MVSHTSDGAFTFRVFSPGSGSVRVVGDFTGWERKPVHMIKGTDGWWSAEVHLPEGEHEFCYLVDGTTWLPDYAAHGVRRNSLGGWISRVHVGARERAPRSLAA
jgi:1,4-alpha-glucan branching enzyme